MIDLEDKYLTEIKDILEMFFKRRPGVSVYMFGSRVQGKTRHSSDVDLAIKGPSKFEWAEIERLKDFFRASSLPYRVDVIDLNAVQDHFKKIIEKDLVEIKYK